MDSLTTASTNRRPLMIIFLVVFIDLLGFGLVLPLMPLYADQLNASPATIGMLQASFSAMQFLFSPFWGRLSDRIGRRPVLLIGLTGSVIFYSLFGWASGLGNLTLMFIARIGAGIAGATISTAQAYIADSTTRERRTAGMAIIGAAFGMGFVFGPLIGALAIYWLGENSSSIAAFPGYLAAGFSAVALLLAIFILPESLKPNSEASHKGWFSFGEFRIALRMPGVASLIAVFFLATFSFAVFETTIALFAKRVFDLDLKHNFYLFAYFGFLLVMAQGGVRSFSKRMSPESIGFTGTVLLLIGMLGLVTASAIHSIALFYVVPVILITGFAFLTTSSQSMISLRSRADEQGGILGLNQSTASLARILGPLVGNATFGVQHQLPYWISAGLMVLVVGMVMLLPASPKEEPVAANS
ncbi:MFS transporter [bacterium]|nr:MFS transporter [bacterium]